MHLVKHSVTSFTFCSQLPPVLLQPLLGPRLFIPCAAIYINSSAGCRATDLRILNGYALVAYSEVALVSYFQKTSCKKLLCVPHSTKTTYVGLIPYQRWFTNVLVGKHA